MEGPGGLDESYLLVKILSKYSVLRIALIDTVRASFLIRTLLISEIVRIKDSYQRFILEIHHQDKETLHGIIRNKRCTWYRQ